MKINVCVLLILSFFLTLNENTASAQNPLIMDQFTADPSARVFEGKVYLYPSHDIRCEEGKGIIGFCMADYHVFSSENLTEWNDHGVIVSQNNVPWVDSTKYSMWAPDCIYRDGKYFFYFPAIADEKTGIKGMGIGVAVSDKPYGPFKPEPQPIAGLRGIDPNPFIDKDGKAYLYIAGMRRLSMVKLKSNMVETASEPVLIEGLPKGFKEGPYMFERKGVYYLTFPYVIDSTETLAYAIGNNPMGPFKYTGVIMDQSPVACWTNHQSIIEYKRQWYLFYHHNDLSPHFDKNRSVCAEYLFFNDDGTIKKVIPTLRGVGISDAGKKIQIDRYSVVSENGASISFIDTSNRHEGWKALLTKKDAWIQYNEVDFGKNLKSVKIKASSAAGGVADILIDKIEGHPVARVKIDKNDGWKIYDSELFEIPSGIHNLIVKLSVESNIEIDWVQFE
ncbi:MAG: family 43 glycosylhydrolase [Bacteroidetes bacterium]|nr:family 43 glycosylhydrolase [Bacteroidota bacterium]